MSSMEQEGLHFLNSEGEKYLLMFLLDYFFDFLLRDLYANLLARLSEDKVP